MAFSAAPNYDTFYVCYTAGPSDHILWLPVGGSWVRVARLFNAFESLDMLVFGSVSVGACLLHRGAESSGGRPRPPAKGPRGSAPRVASPQQGPWFLAEVLMERFAPYWAAMLRGLTC